MAVAASTIGMPAWGAEGKEIGVARDNQIGPRCNSENEHRIVIGIVLCGVPRHSRPDNSTLVSMTARTPPPLGADRLHLRVDFFHRHWLDAGFRHAVGR